jgi:hypothetical protein
MALKLYNLYLDIVEINKIVISLRYWIDTITRLDRSTMKEYELELHDDQIKRTTELIQKIDKQLGYEQKNSLKYEGSYPE